MQRLIKTFASGRCGCIGLFLLLSARFVSAQYLVTIIQPTNGANFPDSVERPDSGQSDGYFRVASFDHDYECDVLRQWRGSSGDAGHGGSGTRLGSMA